MTQASLLSYFSKNPSTGRSLAQAVHGSLLLQKPAEHNADAGYCLTMLEGEGGRSGGGKLEQDVSPSQSQAATSVSQLSLAIITPVDQSHILALKRLTMTILPVRYPDNFFDMTIDDYYAAGLSRVALYDRQPVGWIRCRPERCPSNFAEGTGSGAATNQIYIQTLCLLAPYRGCGLATRLLDTILHSEVVQECNATGIYAHVWQNNEDALHWYERRGFKRILLVDQYYRRLKPAGAWIVRRDI